MVCVERFGAQLLHLGLEEPREAWDLEFRM